MNCGIPYCHNGCPVNNIIPDWNDLVYRGTGKKALAQCCIRPTTFPNSPAASARPRAKQACTLNITDTDPVTIKSIECAIVDKGWDERLGPAADAQAPRPASRVAVVGSGPAGLAAAQQLARAGHSMCIVFEKTTGSAGCCATASPTSSWKST
jgi:glutamate synthase (NADPH/NADH) small chain